jgi:hypothetical protein
LLQRILIAAGVFALLAGCTGEEERAEVEAVVVEEPAPVKRGLSGVERKRIRDAQTEFGRGFNLLFGQQGVHDPEQAHVHLLKAAELGHARSQSLVGVNYQKGRGAEKDPEEAIRWLLLAAENGWPHAQLKVGEAYRDGSSGLEEDPVQAMKWLALAGGGGSIAGSMIAQSYVGSLPVTQRQAGLELARAWRIERGLPVRKQPDENRAQSVVEVRPGPKRRPDAAPTAPAGSPATAAPSSASTAPDLPPAAGTDPIQAAPPSAAETRQPDPAPPAAGA